MENALIHGDCVEEMKKLINRGVKVDMVLCDLPYEATSCEWDKIIPFDILWDCYSKIIKHNGAIVLFGVQPFTSLLNVSNLDCFKEELIWLKNKAGSGFGVKQRHQKIHETISVFSYSSSYTYNPQKWLIAEKEFITQRKTFKDNEYVGNNIYGVMSRKRKIDTGERNPLSIVSCPVPFTPQKTKKYNDDIDLRLHPSQKPLVLCEYLIRTYSNEGDTVLDNCMGSGTTGVACKVLNRNFIGIEKLKIFYDIANKRINEYMV